MVEIFAFDMVHHYVNFICVYIAFMKLANIGMVERHQYSDFLPNNILLFGSKLDNNFFDGHLGICLACGKVDFAEWSSA